MAEIILFYLYSILKIKKLPVVIINISVVQPSIEWPIAILRQKDYFHMTHPVVHVCI